METKIIEKLILAKANMEYEKLQLEVRLEETQAELLTLKQVLDSDPALKELFEEAKNKYGTN